MSSAIKFFFELINVRISNKYIYVFLFQVQPRKLRSGVNLLIGKSANEWDRFKKFQIHMFMYYTPTGLWQVVFKHKQPKCHLLKNTQLPHQMSLLGPKEDHKVRSLRHVFSIVICTSQIPNVASPMKIHHQPYLVKRTLDHQVREHLRIPNLQNL